MEFAETAVHAFKGAKVTLLDSVFRNGKVGIVGGFPGVRLEAINCLIADNVDGAASFTADSFYTLRNCTIVGNGNVPGHAIGYGVHLGASNLAIDNTVIAFNGTGFTHTFANDPPSLLLRNSIVYNPDGENLDWVEDQPGETPPNLTADGNLIADPMFVDRVAGNYELAAGSPAVDAGLGHNSPQADILGRPRYDDAGMTNDFGRGYPAYVDIGAYERQTDTLAGDMSLTSVAAPAPQSLSAGESFQISWTVRNVGVETLSGTWEDKVYLSDDATIGPDDVLVKMLGYSGTLKPGKSYTQQGISIDVPQGVSGPKYILVRANADAGVRESSSRNNFSESSRIVAVDVPLLTTPSPIVASISAGQWRFYRFAADPGDTVRFAVDGDDNGELQLYVRRGLPPTAAKYDAAGLRFGQTDQQARIASTQDDTYYVGVFCRQATANSAYTISAQIAEFRIHDVSPAVVANAGRATIRIEGDLFDSQAQVQLLAPDNTAMNGVTYYASSSTLYTTFDLDASVAPGMYDVRVTNGDSQAASAIGAVEIAAASSTTILGREGLDVRLSVADVARPGRTVDVRIEYTNASNVDVGAPVLTLQSAGRADSVWNIPGSVNQVEGEYFRVMGLSSSGPATILRPGQSESFVVKWQVPFDLVRANNVGYGSDNRPEIDIRIGASATDPDDPDDIPISDVEWDSMQPHSMPAVTWYSTVRPNLESQIGDTWGDYVAALQRNAERWARAGRLMYDVRELFQMELDKAQGVNPAILAGVVRDEEGKPLANAQLVVRREISDTETYLDATVTDDEGRYYFSGLEAGDYNLYIEGYYFDPTPTVTITVGSDQTGVELEALEIPFVEPLEEDNSPLPESDPKLVVDDFGTPHMVWKRGGEIWHAYHDGSQWVSAVIPNANGTDATIAASSRVIDGADSGVIVTWRTQDDGDPANGIAPDSDYSYSIGRRQADGSMQWSEPVTLVNDALDQNNLALAVQSNGQPMTVWQTRDANDSEDDWDLYWNANEINSSDLIWVIPIVASIESLDSHSIPATVSFPLEKELSGLSIPKGVPVLGGSGLVAKIKGVITGNRGCNPRLSGTLTGALEVEFEGSTSESMFGANGEAALRCVCTCQGTQRVGEYVFDRANLGFSVGYQNKVNLVPLKLSASFPKSWPVIGGKKSGLDVKVGPLISVGLGGQIEWIGGNFPAFPTGGQVSGQYGVGVFGKGDVLIVGRGIEAEVTGDVAVQLAYEITRNAWVLSPKWSFEIQLAFGTWKPSLKIDGPDPKGTPLNTAATTEIVGFEFDPRVGTTNVYSGNPVLTDVAQSLSDDGAPTLISLPGGGGIVAWSRDSDDPYAWLGNEIVAASFDGTDWSTPSVIPNSRGFNTDVQLVEHFGQVMAVWSFADSSNITPSSSAEAILTAMGDSDLMYSVWDGANWSSPTLLADTAAADGFVSLGRSADQNVVATWITTDSNDVRSLLASFWDGTTWTTPQTVASRDFFGLPTVGTVAGQTSLYWTEDVGTPAIPQLQLAFSTFDMATQGWTEPVAFSPTGTPATSETGSGNGSFDTDVRYAWLDEAPPDGVTETVVTYFVDQNSLAATGVSSSDAVQRINDAANIWNQANTLVTLQGVSSEADADIYVHFADTSASGSKDNGVLASTQYAVTASPAGVYEDGSPLYSFVSNRDAGSRVQVITLINGWDWYVGASTQVPTDEHDLLTVAVHEFGHFLGLGHGADPRSPMYASISEGVVRRTPTELDLRGVDYLYEGGVYDVLPPLLGQSLAVDDAVASAFSIGKPPEECCKDKKCDENEPDNEKKEKDTKRVRIYTSYTPEDKFGPAGYDASGTALGSEKRWLRPGQTLDYRVEFWNKEDAPVPTQDAVIEDTLDPAIFDLSTFQLTRIGFLKWDVPWPGGQSIDTRIDLRPDMNLAVDVTATLDPTTGKARWWFHAVDPLSGDYPDDPFAGFLPPFNPDTGFEIGWVEFTVKHKPGLPSGTQIKNQAFVEFDFAGDILDHPAPKAGPWVNTLDVGTPSSNVLALPNTSLTRDFLVRWSGQDETNGSGVASYDVFVSVDGGPDQLWIERTKSTSAMYAGQPGHSYAFYSVARDLLGHRELRPSTADAVAVVDGVAPTSTVDQVVLTAADQAITVVLAGSDLPNPAGLKEFEVQIYKRPAGENAIALPSVKLTAAAPSYTFAVDSNTTYYFRSIAIDRAGNREQKAVADRTIYVPDIHAPETHVDNLVVSGATINVPLFGTDQGDGLAAFEIWVQVDDGAWSKLPASVPAGTPNNVGEYRTSASYQAVPGNHTYRFYTRGVDNAGNHEEPPTNPAYDQQVPIDLPAPANVQVTGFDVQRNQDQRSHVQFLDIVFNQQDILDDILNDVAGRIRLEQFDYDGNFVNHVALTNVVSRNSHGLAFDFGTSLVDGFYRLKFDLDGNGAFNDDLSNGLGDSLDFFRMLGDGTGDGKVDLNDRGKDLNGDGIYNSMDASLFSRGYRANARRTIVSNLLNQKDD